MIIAHKNCQLQYLSDSTLDLITPCLLRFPPSTELATCPASHNTPPIQIEKCTLKPSVKVLSPNFGFSMFSICFPYLFHIFPSFSRWISAPSGHLCALTLSRCSQEVMSSASPRPAPWKKVASSCQRSLASSGRWGGNFLVKNREKWWIYLISPSKNGGNHGFHHDFHHGKLMDQPNMIQVSCISWISWIKGWMSGNISTGNRCFYR